MTLALLILISMMWVPVGLLLYGSGEGKGTGFVTAVVGVLVVVGAIIQAAVFADAFTAGLLFVFGVLYLQFAYALLAGLTDMRTLGNGAIVVCVVCAVYAYLFATGGGVKPDGTTIIGISKYLSFMCVTFTILCACVVLNCYGKLSGKVVGFLLILLTITCLWTPAIALLAYGKLPF